MTTTPPGRPSPIVPRSERLVRWLVLGTAVLASAAVWWPVQAARIKEVASVQGVRANQLTGFGLVFGLDGTGDQSTQSPFTPQALAAFLEKNGIALPPGVTMQPKNLAAVVVTAELPAFAQRGQRIDVNVSSAGNAKSLRGGMLLSTPLRGADGRVYAIAQGNLIVGGAGASAGGSKVQINHLAAGRVPEGAMVEEVVATSLGEDGVLQLDVNANDFATARAVAGAINESKGAGTAQAMDGRVVKVRLPADESERVGFIADLENLPVTLAKPAARIVLNARTGSVVVNEAVTLADCAVAHGALSVTINAMPVISQPSPLSQGGQTVVSEKADITIQQQGGALIQLPAAAKLSDVVKALNSLGATPQDLLAILQAMKAAGALKAEIEVI
ncbi:flagellar basal body P-ring protein FlgI [Ideonella sp. A 288]|uniref:flagellar basal body P-ring protein FlgI n=1 Tax=Ideonella sp. A 288 TaxID=1962181 RepID=UPI000B4C14F5|nr:flagellar basal body P-ring protein FlgI [Ideonella sp. A 288]